MNYKKQNKKKFNFVGIVGGPFFRKLYSFRESNKALYRKFVKLFMKCDSIFFGRMSDQEKPKVIEMVQSYDDRLITLAIGDGANDLGMFK